MLLNGPQSQDVHNIIDSHFGGQANSPAEFATFVRYKLDVDPYRSWADPSDRFRDLVANVLKKLRDDNLTTFLNALIDRMAEEEDDGSIQIIRRIQGALTEEERRRKEQAGKTGGGDPPPLPRKILVAASTMDEQFAKEIAKLLQRFMDGFEVVGVWDNKVRLPNDLDKVAAVIALLNVKDMQKGVREPPSTTVQAALDALDPARRIVLLALNPLARSWTNERIKNITLKECVETEEFFGEDGKSILFRTDTFRAAEIASRVGDIADRLQDAFEKMTAANRSAQTPPRATSRRSGLAPIIVLGEPQGPASQDVTDSIKDLTAVLKKRGMEFVVWPDAWRNGKRRPAHILFKDPVFLRTVANGETATKRVAEDLDKALRSVFDARDATLDLLSSCRRVLWRPAGLAWDFLDQDADPSLSSDDLDNIETRVAPVPDFVDWLARFIAPDAVIFHETLGGNRPPELIRLLRDAVGKSLSTVNRKAIIRLRAFKELSGFGNDKLTVVAVDDLPLRPGVDFHDKARQRFNQFQYKIDNILDQRRTGADDPAILRVAMLVQGASGFEHNDLGDWKPFRIGRDNTTRFRAEDSDVQALHQATAELMKKIKASAQAGGGTQ